MVGAMKTVFRFQKKKHLQILLLAALLAPASLAQAALDRHALAGGAPQAGPYFTGDFLGGVAVPQPGPAVGHQVYRIAVTGAYGPAAGEVVLQDDAEPALDPIKTASIIPGVFGSVAISMHNFPASSRWASVYRAIRACGTACDRASSGFSFIIDAVKNKSFSDKLAFVNSGVNQLIAYRKDSTTYGKADYWAEPEEILARRAGDCEDFAILKMAALLQSGIPASSMSLVVLQDSKRGVFHAVLSVSTSSGTFVLDNLDNRVVKDTALPNYVPLYSFSTDRAWVHGAKTGESRVASLRGGLAAIAPGEGPTD
ncbi:transglutaminase-like cysteine peptidase [Mesorhizobium sp. 8]|uniref:transglutaminase-like cysteine peptidase n=1 Tax=Mesorhizobium sp. 8 TaxID=2584466 RepID=UPI001FEF1165|nr:transglutaminase-like cysteine peptidase [Mesorhizobium sp. 8]